MLSDLTLKKMEKMHQIKSPEEYAEEVGGIFSSGDLEAIPFNHWKKDCEWIILVLDLTDSSNAFIPVQALTAREACDLAFSQYNHYLEENDEF